MNALLKSLLTCALTAGLFVTTAKSDELDTVKALCKANPQCVADGKYDTGALRFFIRSADGIKYIRCETNGSCTKLYPRGQGGMVGDKEKLFAAK